MENSSQSKNSVPNCNINKLVYLPDNSVILDLPYILTLKKRLIIGFPYMKHEKWLADSRVQAVRLIKVWDVQNIVYLKIQDLETAETDIVSANLAYDGDYWLWSLASFEYLVSHASCAGHQY